MAAGWYLAGSHGPYKTGSEHNIAENERFSVTKISVSAKSPLVLTLLTDDQEHFGVQASIGHLTRITGVAG